MKAAFAKSICLLALFCFASATASPQEEVKTSDFTEITGKVVDSSNKPIEKFKVVVAIYDYTKGGWNVTPETLEKWDGEFENGEFKFEVDETFAINEKTYISLTITAEGYLNQNRNGNYIQLSTFKGKFAKTKFSRAVKLRGKIVLPDGSSEEKLVSPKVYVTKKMSGFNPDWNNMFQHQSNVLEDGSFEVPVPENCTLMLTASSANAAAFTQEFKVPKSQSEDEEKDLGEVKLKDGVSPSGIVLDRDGKPVEGQIVQLKQEISHGRFLSSTVYGWAQSDAEGKFTLPPREGKCSISLVESANIDGKQVKAKGVVLKTKPVKLTLKADVPVNDIEIKEGKTWKIGGVVKFDGGKPTLNYSLGDGSNQKQVELGEDGQFEFEVVDGVTPWIMLYNYDQTEEGVYYTARMSKDSARKFRKHFSNSPDTPNQFYQFNKVTSDIGPLEFKMIKQVYETRSMSEMFLDWYFLNDDE